MRRPTVAAALLAVGLVAAACTGNGSTTRATPAAGPPPAGPIPAALALLESSAHPSAVDTFEVWVCHVPDTTPDPVYVPGGLRLPLDSIDVATRLQATIPTYFDALSHGAYEPRFVAGGAVDIQAEEGHQQCIDRALDASGASADAVYVVADAEHQGDQPGGWAQPGSGCACPARTSRRMVYVGASDFHPDWGATPAVDLSEHEIGHTLGLPHSLDEASLASGDEDHVYSSALDVMSNSAAPREVDPDRRDGPATIAANLIALGWLPRAAIAVVPPAGADVELLPSTAASGVRVAVIALDDDRLLTVELLTPTGYDGHLSEAGVAVHLVDQSPAACGHAVGDPCTSLERHQVVLGSAPPHPDLLAADEDLQVDGWSISVRALTSGDDAAARVALRPTER
jgi:hypothetical protein